MSEALEEIPVRGQRLYARYCGTLRRVRDDRQPQMAGARLVTGPPTWEFLSEPERRAWMRMAAELEGDWWLDERPVRFMTDDELQRASDSYYDAMDFGAPSADAANRNSDVENELTRRKDNARAPAEPHDFMAAIRALRQADVAGLIRCSADRRAALCGQAWRRLAELADRRPSRV